ncbi:MAG TPA: hypothetical protein VGG64_20700 [Pirellulales bacterium]
MLITSAAYVLIFGSPVGAIQTVVDDARGFTLTLPDDFVANPKLVGAAPNIIHGFVLGDPTDDKLDIVLLIEKMGGTISREPLTLEDLPPDFRGRLFKTQWQGFAVDAFEIPEAIDQTRAVTYNVQLPLKRAAIQVKLFGPADRESELQSLLATILSGLKGESNWLQSAVPTLPITSSQTYRVILLAFAVIFILTGIVLLWLVSRKAPKGAVLVVAVVIYCGGLALAGSRVREVVMLKGALTMLGFIGGVMGVVDLLRKRKPPAKDAG